jgi:hypothetical protein
MLCDSSLFVTEAASFLRPKGMAMAMAMVMAMAMAIAMAIAMAMAQPLDLSGQNLR